MAKFRKSALKKGHYVDIPSIKRFGKITKINKFGKSKFYSVEINVDPKQIKRVSIGTQRGLSARVHKD